MMAYIIDACQLPLPMHGTLQYFKLPDCEKSHILGTETKSSWEVNQLRECNTIGISSECA